MKEQKKQPELRFKGFTDDWEERKLGDILSERNDQMPETNEYPLMSFVQGKGVTPKGERYNRSFLVKDSEKKYKKTELGDFIYSSNNLETGSIGFNKTGKAVISPVYSIFKSKKSRESQFIGIMSARKDFISKMVRFRQGVVYGQWRIHESDFLNIDMKIPNDKEQQLIISFFENIDKTIALHQRKHDLLKKLKQGYLQQMFPVKNEVVPQLRFSGFKDDWGQSKFKNIIIRVNKSSNSNKLPKIEFEDISAGEGRLNKDISKKFDTRKGIEFEPNDILYGKLRPYLKNWLMPNFKGIALGDFWIFRSTNNISNFVYNLIQTNKYQKAANDTSGTKMPRSDWKKVSETMFFISKNLEEQQKIGEFFQKLDQDLSLQQLKIEQLQQLKQAYLQKLFP